jgi:ABC-type multidrug transport system fused ATPase/permease subunit
MGKNIAGGHQLKIIDVLIQLWGYINLRRKVQFKWLLGLMLLSSLAEVLSLGMVVPFLSVLSNPQSIFEEEKAKNILRILSIGDTDELLLTLTAIFCITALIAGITRLYFLTYSAKVTYLTGAELSTLTFEKTIEQDYEVHIRRNSSEIIDIICNKVSIAIHFINMTVNLIGAVIILFSIILILLYVNVAVSAISFLFFSLAYISIYSLTRKGLKSKSKIISDGSPKIVQVVQEGLGGIRDILLDGNQKYYAEIYRKLDAKFRRAQGDIIIISTGPRYILETIGIIFISLVAYYLCIKNGGSIISELPVLGILVISSQRLLPILQQIYSSYIAIQNGLPAAKQVLSLLDTPNSIKKDIIDLDENKILLFEEKIELKNVSFKYHQTKRWIFEKINLKIVKGEILGIIGKTGSGKSTLVDILMGLLAPQSGCIKIDEQIIDASNIKSYQALIAHVPQNIFLLDASIAENIALGSDGLNIDIEKIHKVAKEAEIYEFISSLPDKFETRIGERGIKFSGGQRQRLGIARALYRGGKILIFDEATSALDIDTEESILTTVNSLGSNYTIIIITHRLSSLKFCNNFIVVSNGKIKNEKNNIS